MVYFHTFKRKMFMQSKGKICLPFALLEMDQVSNLCYMQHINFFNTIGKVFPLLNKFWTGDLPFWYLTFVMFLNKPTAELKSFEIWKRCRAELPTELNLTVPLLSLAWCGLQTLQAHKEHRPMQRPYNASSCSEEPQTTFLNQTTTNTLNFVLIKCFPTSPKYQANFVIQPTTTEVSTTFVFLSMKFEPTRF